MVNQTVLARMAFWACFFAFSVIALGAFTRLIDAGLGCPDWPGCYGRWIVPASMNQLDSHFVQYKAWAEMAHRYAVGILSGFIVVMVVSIMALKNFRVRSNVYLAILLLLLLGYQIMLGQWTVTLKLLPVIVSQHLLGGFLILSVLWLLYLSNRNHYQYSHHFTFFKIAALFGLVLLFVQIALGAWTSTNYAALACPDFPFCSNEGAVQFQFKPAFNLFAPIGVNYEGGVLSHEIRQSIHMMHRIGALVLSVYMIIFVMMASVKLKPFPDLMRSVYVVLAVLLLQLCVGMSNVIFKLPLLTAELHNLLAAILLLSLITLLFKLFFVVKVSYEHTRS